MGENKKVELFLKEKKMTAIDMAFEPLVERFLSEMDKGLNGEESSLQMNPSYLDVNNKIEFDENVICIDAGGTNLRIALTNIDKNGNFNVIYFKKYFLPGTDGEISSDEFFDTLAKYIEPIADKSDKIGFSFAFVAEALKNADARVSFEMCKEVKVSNIKGKVIGEELNKAFMKIGISEKKVTVINDTVSSLLSGITSDDDSAYIGFILGTGTNTAITSKSKYVKKIETENDLVIINNESGVFDKVEKGYFDEMLDKGSDNPNDHIFEKMVSGGYLGKLISLTFSDYVGEEHDFTTEDISLFLLNERKNKDILSLNECQCKILKKIAEILSYRAMKLTAIKLTACAVKSVALTGKRKVIISAEGTTFHKFYKFRENVINFLDESLKKQRSIDYKIISVDNSVIKGCAIAALLNK